MAFNTGNPIGSTDPRDLSDNSENFDDAVNNTASATWTDRFGNTRTSLAGQVGYIGTGTGGAIESYTSGLVLTTYSTIILYSGEFYRPSSDATLPYTTTATTPDVDSNLVAVGDAVLRQDLANSAATFGSELVSRSVLQKKSIAEVEALTGTVNNLVYLDLGLRFGAFYWDGSNLSAQVTADPEQGVYIAPSSDATGASGAWVRQDTSRPNPRWFGGLIDGTLSDTALQACVNLFPGVRIYLDDGEHNYSVFPTGIDGVRFEGSSRITWTNVELPIFNGVFTGGREVALVGGVLRYYATGPSGAGWYMLVDQGQNHDPILAGPVSASGSNSVILDINIQDFGLDPTLWTPAGFVCGPDEALAQQGVSVGASVGTTSVTIQGSVSNRQPEFIESNGTTFSGSSSRYVYSWINEGASNARLIITRDNAASFLRVNATTQNNWPIVTSRQRNGSGAVRPLPSLAVTGTDGSGNVQYEISFWSMVDGSRVTAQSAEMQFWMHDPTTTPRAFIWDDLDPTIQAGSNIWFSGTFVRKPGSL